MTWKTPQGERVLSAPEAILFASAIEAMIEFDNMGEGLNFGSPLVVGPFQRLVNPKKYTVLEQVARALLHPTPTCPELTATNESAICYVFHWLKEQFGNVKAGEDEWGPKVIEALADEEEQEVFEDEDGYRPRIGCLDGRKWNKAMEELADRILWDRDFEMEDLFTNSTNPDATAQLMSQADIDPDYFQPFTLAASRGAKERLHDLVRAILE